MARMLRDILNLSMFDSETMPRKGSQLPTPVNLAMRKIENEEVLRDIFDFQLDFGQGPLFRELNSLSAGYSLPI